MFVSVSEFLYYKLLKSDNICDIKQSFYLIKYHDTELTSNAAESILSHYH